MINGEMGQAGEARPGRGWQSGPFAASSNEPWATRPAGSSTGTVLWGLGLLMGAAAMYLLDAENGEQRRATVTRRVSEYRNEVERTLDRESERAISRVRGTAREVLWRVRSSMVPDRTILREINARIEEIMPFEEAGQVFISVERGRVLLEGSIAEERLNRLLAHVATVPGVRGLDNHLSVRSPRG
jgi:osmotically-inducible protein OsmY